MYFRQYLSTHHLDVLQHLLLGHARVEEAQQDVIEAQVPVPGHLPETFVGPPTTKVSSMST